MRLRPFVQRRRLGAAALIEAPDRAVLELPQLLPLFPLPNVVLFPQMALPLHVFEPRYRKLVADVRESHKTIGMMLLRAGWEADYHGRPAVFPIGCAGVVQQVEELPEGRFNILLKGLTRFRLGEEHAGEPYRLARVDRLQDPLGDLASLEAARRDVLAAIAKAPDGPAIMILQNEMPHELFVNAMAQSLSLAAVEQQSLLDCDSILARYHRLLEILDFRLLEHAHGKSGRPTLH
jgi:uncharacterized protein